jgi:hypothetical protein
MATSTTVRSMRAVRRCLRYGGAYYKVVLLQPCPLHRPGFFKATSKVVVIEEGVLMAQRAQQGARSPQNGSYARFGPRWYKRQMERLEKE